MIKELTDSARAGIERALTGQLTPDIVQTVMTLLTVPAVGEGRLKWVAYRINNLFEVSDEQAVTQAYLAVMSARGMRVKMSITWPKPPKLTAKRPAKKTTRPSKNA